MAALLADILALLELLTLGAEVISALEDFIEVLTGTSEPDYEALTNEEKTAILRRVTKIVANLGLDLACYPLGYTTTILFDLDGEPIFDD